MSFRASRSVCFCVLLALVAEVAAVMFAPAWADAAPQRRPRVPANWVLAKVGTPTPAMIHAEVFVEVRPTGVGPLVIGVGLSVQGGPHPFSWVSVARRGGGSPSIAMGVNSERFGLQIEQVRHRGESFTAHPVRVQDEASVVAVLLFAVNGEIGAVDWRARAEGVGATTSVRRGSGATALAVSDPASGASANAAGTAVGVTRFSRKASAGVVGAIEWVSCQVCSGSWTPPGGRPRMWAHARNHAWAACWCATGLGIKVPFAGPAGDWGWTWQGVASQPDGILGTVDGGPQQGVANVVADPVAAAYAPIGADWVLFSECRFSQHCALSWPLAKDTAPIQVRELTVTS